MFFDYADEILKELESDELKTRRDLNQEIGFKCAGETH